MVAAFHIGKVPPALPSIRDEMGASLTQAGWLLSIVNLTTAIGGMAIALMADRFGHRRLVMLGTALCLLASLGSAAAGGVATLLVGRVFEGLGFIAVVVAIPTLVLRLAAPSDQRLAMALWSTYMPAGAGVMMLVAAVVLLETSWRGVWIVAAAASAAMLVGLLLRALPSRELDPIPMARRPVLVEMAEVATRGGPLAIALCFGAYSCCWYTVVGFLPTLLIERLGFTTPTAAIVTAGVTFVNVGGNLLSGWLLQRGVARGVVIVGAALPMAVCAAGIFVDGVPDLLRLVLAGLYSAVIGVVPAALFAAISVHAGRPQLVGAATGLLMQVSNFGALLGPPIAAALVSAGGWPAAAWLTSIALGIVAAAALFLQRREGRKVTA
jgi:MFS transporter, DHA1 family, inner membrane transport protein